jgi:hypothetical protein
MIVARVSATMKDEIQMPEERTAPTGSTTRTKKCAERVSTGANGAVRSGPLVVVMRGTASGGSVRTRRRRREERGREEGACGMTRRGGSG